MLDHVSLQCADPAATAAFYVRIFASHGLQEAMRVDRPEGTVIGLSGPDGFPHLWFGPLVDAGQRPIHLALAAPERSSVDAVHDAALREGATVLHEPRVWPEYHDGYYAVFLRDPDGTNVESVHHAFASSTGG